MLTQKEVDILNNLAEKNRCVTIYCKECPLSRIYTRKISCVPERLMCPSGFFDIRNLAKGVLEIYEFKKKLTLLD